MTEMPASEWMTKNGVNIRRFLKLLEKLEQGKHWHFGGKKRGTMITAAGVAELDCLIAPRDAAKKPLVAVQAAATPAAVPKNRDCHIATITQIYRNKRAMAGVVDGRESLITVRDNSKFWAGAKIPVEREDNNKWRFSGRLPHKRWRNAYLETT